MKEKLKWCAIVVFSIVIATSALGHETDQYTLPEGRVFADLGRYLNNWAFAAIERGVNKTNGRLSRGGAIDLTTPPARDEIVRAVNSEFGSAFDVIEGLERLVSSSAFMKQYPGKVTGYKQNLGNIYQHVHFPLDPRQFFRLFQASTFMAYGTYLGSDKIGHFTDMGMHYYRAFSAAKKDGASDDVAFDAAVKVGTDHPMFGEKGMVGYGSAGDYSNADLVANLLGLLFYLNLTDPMSIKGQMQPAMLERSEGGWRIAPHVRRDSDFFAIFLSDHLDEALNPGLFEQSMRSAIRKAIQERSAVILNRRADAHGNRRTKEYFDGTLGDLTTYYGRHYGHQGEYEDLISIGSTCFDPLGADAEPDARNSWGWTPLHQAAAQGDLNAVKRLLQRGAKVNAPVRSDERYSPEWGNVPLHYAARDGRRDVVEHLIASGANVNASNDRGMTPLHRALAYRDLASLLIDNGARVDAADARGYTPLHWAAHDGQPDAVDLLLRRGASVRTRTTAGFTALHLAAQSGSTGSIVKLLGYGADINALANGGLAPIHVAARRGHIAAIDLLLAHGADVRTADQFKWTALHEAAGAGGSDVAAFLLAQNADAAAVNTDGNTPLHLAARGGREGLVQLLVESGAPINAQNRRGDTSLHEAAFSGNSELVRLMLDRGARSDIRNAQGDIPAEVAARFRYSAVAEILERHARQTPSARDSARRSLGAPVR